MATYLELKAQVEKLMQQAEGKQKVYQTHHIDKVECHFRLNLFLFLFFEFRKYTIPRNEGMISPTDYWRTSAHPSLILHKEV